MEAKGYGLCKHGKHNSDIQICITSHFTVIDLQINFHTIMMKGRPLFFNPSRPETTSSSNSLLTFVVLMGKEGGRAGYEMMCLSHSFFEDVLLLIVTSSLKLIISPIRGHASACHCTDGGSWSSPLPGICMASWWRTCSDTWGSVRSRSTPANTPSDVHSSRLWAATSWGDLEPAVKTKCWMHTFIPPHQHLV